jgi:nicotinamide-nucleotide amidase
MSKAFRRDIVKDEEAENHLTNFFVQLRRTPTENQRRQAKVLEGAAVYMNPVGIAPGQRLTLSNSRHLWLLPGPPRELRGLIQSALRPWLETAITRKDHHQAIFRLAGQSESAVQDRVTQMNNFREVGIAYCATPGSTELRFTGTEERVQELSAQTRVAFADDIINETGEVVEAELVTLLTQRKQTLALAESCTGGGLGECITSVPGSSSCFLGGMVTYSDESKQRQLGVDPDALSTHGAVSAEVAEAMASGVRQKFQSDWAISITGIAGPAGGSPDKPIGLFFVGIAGPSGTQVHRHQVGGNREQIREHAIQRAMIALWRAL